MHNFSFDRSSHFSDVNYTDYYWFNEGFTAEELQRIESQTGTIDFEKGKNWSRQVIPNISIS